MSWVCWWYLMIALAHLSTSSSSSSSSSHSFLRPDLLFLRLDCAPMDSVLALSSLTADGSVSTTSAPCSVSASLLRFFGGSLALSRSSSLSPSSTSGELSAFWQSLSWLSLSSSSSSASRTFRSSVWRRDLRIGRPLASRSGECYSNGYNQQQHL